MFTFILSILNCRLPQIYEEFYHTINNADHNKDLKWWSNNHGVMYIMIFMSAHLMTLLHFILNYEFIGEHGDGMARICCKYKGL